MTIILAAGTQARWWHGWQYDHKPGEVARPKQLVQLTQGETLLDRTCRLFHGPKVVVVSPDLAGSWWELPDQVPFLIYRDSPSILASILYAADWIRGDGYCHVLCGDVWWSEALVKQAQEVDRVPLKWWLNGSEIFGFTFHVEHWHIIFRNITKALNAKGDAKLWDLYYEFVGHEKKGHHPPSRDQWIPEGDLTTDIDYALQYGVLKGEREK